MRPNGLAWSMLAAWPAISLAVYASAWSRRRLAYVTAWMILVPLMFLPSALSLEAAGIPALDKHRMAFLPIAIGLQLFHPERARARGPGAWFPRAVLLVLAAGAVATVWTNHDRQVFGPTALPALSSWDLVSICAQIVLDIYVPFTVGQRVFRSEEDLRELFRALSAAGLVYAPLALLEVRLSPQLHRWVYGYHQHQFAQMMRGSGYRPMVFMTHGLSVALFFVFSLAAALALRRVRARTWVGPPSSAVISGTIVLLCKSMASILYSAVVIALEPLARRRSGARILALTALLVAAYPVSRAAGAFPGDTLVRWASWVSPARAQSLAFRFANEDRLLERALQRPWFGWGTFGRNRVYADWGGDISTTDGRWIVIFGCFGAVGLAGFLALMLAPILRFARNGAYMTGSARALAGVVATLVAVCAIDLVPNAWADFLPIALAGGLYSVTRRVPGRRAATSGARDGMLRRPAWRHGAAATVARRGPPVAAAGPFPGRPERGA